MKDFVISNPTRKFVIGTDGTDGAENNAAANGYSMIQYRLG